MGEYERCYLCGRLPQYILFGHTELIAFFYLFFEELREVFLDDDHRDDDYADLLQEGGKLEIRLYGSYFRIIPFIDYLALGSRYIRKPFHIDAIRGQIRFQIAADSSDDGDIGHYFESKYLQGIRC